jgi:hypothetical protein
MQTAFTLPMQSFRLNENQDAVALAAISFGLRRALRLGLRVADGLGEYLAKLSRRLRLLAREGSLPLAP